MKGYVIYTDDKVSRKFAPPHLLDSLLQHLRRQGISITRPIEYGEADGKEWRLIRTIYENSLESQ